MRPVSVHEGGRPCRSRRQGSNVEVVRGGADVLDEFVGLQSECSIGTFYGDCMDFRQAIGLRDRVGLELSAIVPHTVGHLPLLVEAGFTAGPRRAVLRP